MKSAFAKIRAALLLLAIGLGVAASANGQVTLTAVSSSGSTVLTAGQTFNVTLTWAGSPPVAGADYAVTLNTDQLLLTGRTFNASLGSYADTPYIQSFPAATSRIDITWFKDTGFTGNDVTLQFQVPANYTGPGVVTIGLSVDGAQDVAATAVEVTPTGTSVNVQQNFVDGSASDSGTANRTVNWVSGTPLLAWSPSTPGTGGLPDRATINLSSSSTSGDYFVDFNQNLTLNRITVNMSGTVNYKLGTGTRRTITWIARGTDTATLDFIQSSGNPLRNWLTADSVLNTDLYVKLSHQGSRDSNLGGILSGSGKLTVDYFNNVNNSTGTGGYCLIGTANDAASTHTGGTRLLISSAATNSTPANFPFRAAKTNAFGTGALELNKARLDLQAFSQTVGGLADGANGSSITDTSSSTTNSSTTTLTLTFATSTQTFTGAINDGTTRKIALTKTGTGTQVLSAAQGYTGATTISGGNLRVTGSLAAGSAVGIGASGTLSGTGTVNGATSNSGTIAPGTSSIGTLNMAGVTMAAGSRLEVKVASWTGSTPGTHWDFLNCSSMALAGTSGSPVVLKLVPSSLAGFTESQKTFTIATSTANITGFASNAITVDASSMPGTGTWSAQLSATGKSLEVTYTPLPNAAPVFAGYSASTSYQSALTIGLSKLLAKISDPDEDGFSITAAGPSSTNGGTVSLGASSITYTPANGFSGADSFSITITDTRGATATGTINLTVGANPNAGGTQGTNAPTVTVTGGSASLRFRAIPGTNYLLQRSIDGMQTWQDVDTLTTDQTGVINWSETGNYPNAFYRFRQP